MFCIADVSVHENESQISLASVFVSLYTFRSDALFLLKTLAEKMFSIDEKICEHFCCGFYLERMKEKRM